MKTPLTRVSPGVYRHTRLGVDIEKTSMTDFPWQLSSPDPASSGVVVARVLGDARAFLREIEERIDREYEAQARSLRALGETVRQERERKDFSAAALAAATGIPTSKLQAFEAGCLDPEFDLMVALAQALEIKPSTLIIRAEKAQAPEARSSLSDAESALLALHRYLFPERYEDVPTHEWDPSTVVEVADMLERALVNHPQARLSPK